MRSEKALYKGIPLLIEALVHGENPVRNARGKEQFFLLEFQIDKHSRNVLRGKRTVGRKQCPFQILRGEQKDKFKIRRSLPLIRSKHCGRTCSNGRKESPVSPSASASSDE